jgi:transcriptional regulator of NAD metabolism
MLYTGTVILESLHDESVLNFVENVQRETAELVDALADQPKTVTIATFTVKEEMAPAVADELNRLIKHGHWYADVCHEFDCYIIFPGKVFHFMPKETEKRQKAFDYAKSLQIPESQIAF